MYIWKIDKLNQQLISSELSEPDAFKYIMANTILYSLAMIEYTTPNEYDTYNGILGVFLSIIGVWFIYKCNGGKNGKYFIGRYISISWVVFVRFTVLFLLPAAIAMIAVQELYMGGMTEQTTVMDMTLIIISEIVYFLWLGKHINYVAKQTHA